MVGEPIRYVKAGSNVVLRCIVRDALEPPVYISWFYNSHQIYNENVQGWRLTFDRNILPQLDVPSQALSSSSAGSGGAGSIPLLTSAGAAGAMSSSFYHPQRPATLRSKSVRTQVGVKDNDLQRVTFCVLSTSRGRVC